MKKTILIIVMVLSVLFTFSAVYAQDTVVESDEMIEEKDWTDYYDSYHSCFALLDDYQEDLESFYSGASSTTTSKWRNLRKDLRWDAAVTCGYIMSVVEPDELSDYMEELVYASYYQLAAIELYIQSINNDNDQKLYSLYEQMAAAAQELKDQIVLPE